MSRQEFKNRFQSQFYYMDFSQLALETTNGMQANNPYEDSEFRDKTTEAFYQGFLLGMRG